MLPRSGSTVFASVKKVDMIPFGVDHASTVGRAVVGKRRIVVHAASFHLCDELGVTFFQACRVDVSFLGVAFRDSLSVRVVVDGSDELVMFCVLTAEMVVTENLRRQAPHPCHQSHGRYPSIEYHRFR
jgi:hypothetical protein